MKYFIIICIILCYACKATKGNSDNNNIVIIRSKNTVHESTGNAKLKFEGKNNIIEVNYDSSYYASKNDNSLTIIKGDQNHIIVEQKKVVSISENRNDTTIIEGNKQKFEISAINVIDTFKNISQNASQNNLIAKKSSDTDLKSATITKKTISQSTSQNNQIAKKSSGTDLKSAILRSATITNNEIKSKSVIQFEIKNLDEDSIHFLPEGSEVYIKGKEKPVPAREAFAYYANEIKNGNVKGYYHIALYYQTGIGTKINSLKAEEYLEIAARKGIPEAQYDLGFMYEYGFWKVMANREKAIYYYKMAAAQGNIDAKERLKELDP